MQYTIKNNTNKDMSMLNNMVDAYFPYAKKEMGFDLPVTIIFETDQVNAENPLGKTAYYDPSNHKVVLYVDNRHPKDIMRSLSHELVHHKQNCNGELEGITGEQGYAQTEQGHKIEEEAYSLGNTCFRNWEDSVKKQINETTYSIKGDKKMKLNESEIRDIIKASIKKVVASRTEKVQKELQSLFEDGEKKKKGDKKPDGDGDGVPPWADKDDDDPEVQEEAAVEKEDAEETDEEKPLKEWYGDSLYGKLLKEYTRRDK